MTDQVATEKRPRTQFVAVLKSKEHDSNYSAILEAGSRRELAKVLADTLAAPGGSDLELVVALRGKKLIAQEKKTVQFA